MKLIRDIERFRLLMEYHSFLSKLEKMDIWKKYKVSVSLRSIIHSYNRSDENDVKYWKNGFPSPYGVSFILIYINIDVNTSEVIVSVSLRSIIHSYEVKRFLEENKNDHTFPSPYGVSFILIVSILINCIIKGS